MMRYFFCGAVSALAGAILYANLPTRYTIGATSPKAQFLNKTILRKVISDKELQDPVIVY